MDFQKEVIDKSFDKPVVVDFWAPWCGPCRVLGPTIEQIAEEQKESWTLVKLNTEEEQQVATEYQIRSIPNVKMFHKGEVIAEFAGSLPRTSILNWLEEHLPNETKASLEEILQRLQQEDPLALKELQALVVDYPEIKEARLALAQQVVFTDPVQALQLIQDFAEGYKFYDEANYLKDLVNFMQFVPTDDSEVGKKIVAAQIAAEQTDLESAIQLIIDAVSLNKDYNGALPRKTGVAIFRTLGTAHQLTKSYRWKFDMMLY